MKLSIFALSLLLFSTIYSQSADTLYKNGKVIIRSNIIITMDSGELKARQNAPSPLAAPARQNNPSQGRQANLCGVVSSFTPNRNTSFSIPFSQTFTSTSTNATSYQWIQNGITYSTQPSVVFGFYVVGLYEIQLIAKNGTCTDTSTVYYLYTGAPTATPRTTMLNNYGFPDREEYSTCMDHVPNGGFVLGGYSNLYLDALGDRGLVVKISEAGCVQWSKLFQEYPGRVGDLTDQDKTVATTQATLVAVNAQIAGFNAAIATMPDGEAKKGLQSKMRRLNDQKENLEERLEKGGTTAFLETELDAELSRKQVEEIDAFIASINLRKAEL